MTAKDKAAISSLGEQNANVKGRLLFVDGLRGIAAAMVVLYHLVGRTPAQWVSARGYLGVSVFFVLSGFVIAMAIGKRTISLGFLGRFAARRALRLDPPYWVSIAVAIAATHLAAKLGVSKELPSTSQIIAHVIYLQDILGYKPISEVYWTLCLEIQFYLFLIVLLWSGSQRVELPRFQCGLLALLLLSLLEHADIVDISPAGVFLPYWYGFTVGVITYWVVTDRLAPRMLWGTLLLLAVFAPFRHGDAVVVTMVTASVIYLAYRFKKMDIWLSGHMMQLLGKISYSLYLFHPLVGWSAQSLALRLTNEWAALVIGLAASLIAAWAAYLVIEQPAIRWSHMVSLKGSVLR